MSGSEHARPESGCPRHVWRRDARGDHCLHCGERRDYQEHDQESEAVWNCGRCGYPAQSSPHVDTEKGTEIDKCPKCGEQWWLDKDTYARMEEAS